MRAALKAACWIAALVWAGVACAQEQSRLLSPNGRVEVRFSVKETQPAYEVLFDGRSVIAPSSLGLEMRGGSIVNVQTIGESRGGANRRLSGLFGKASEVRNVYNEATFSLQETAPAARRLGIVFRAYDDGAAFRYVLPAQPGVTDVAIWGERTRFNFPIDYACLGANVGRFAGNHEVEFDPVRASLIRPHNLFDMPLVCSGPGVAFAIAEADLENYSALYLSGRGEGGLGVAAQLSPRIDDPGLAVRLAMDEDGAVTPWRVVMLADIPGRLIESNLIANLNPPPDLDTSWARPGRTAWDWWSGSQAAVAKPGMNTETMRAYIDFAADNGFEYVLIDDGWYVGANGWIAEPHADITRPVPELNLPDLIAHARERRVGVWLWMHWRLLDARMDEAMATYRRWGVAGIKVDYMDRDDQEMVDFYHRLMRRAAANRLMVDLHGAYPPRGMARTYPHFLTQEGVLGAEYNKWSRRVTARHNVTLAYTRMLLGPMDYTPGATRNAMPETFEARWLRPEVMTTRAHGLAMYVVYDSPFVSIADSPDSYEGQAGLDFLRAAPSSWDETRFIAGEVGEYVAVARRRGRDWFIGVMNNETARDVPLPLDFLGAGRYRAEIWADAAAPTAVSKSDIRIDAATPLVLHIAANGGAAIRLRR